MSNPEDNVELTSEQLEALVAEVTEDTSIIDNMDENTLTQLRKYMNPYGRTIQGQGKYTVLSVVNLKEEFMRRLIMTGMVEFSFRMKDEWRDDELIDANNENNSNVIDEIKHEREVIDRFLGKFFRYDEKEHVMSSHNAVDKNQLSEDTIVPPEDTYIRWEYYMNVNYERLRELTQKITVYPPDIEFMINPFDQFDNTDEANEFIERHKKEVITDVNVLTNNKWNLMGPFKDNRERINFYNENTELLEEILKQVESDKKMGAELMRKRVARKKIENIKKYGPDDEAFRKWKKENENLSHLGAESLHKKYEDDVKAAEEEYRRNNSNSLSDGKEEDDSPDNAVEVGIIKLDAKTGDIKRDKFYTEAVAPTKDEVKAIATGQQIEKK